MTTNADVLKSTEDSKRHLDEVLSQVTPDDALISGILNFVRSKFLTLIVKDITESLNKASAESEHELKMGQEEKLKKETAEYLIDKIWSDFYHPVFKYYQGQHEALNGFEGQKRKRVVETRKLNQNFKKIAKQSRDFYYDLLKNVLTQHRIDFIIPEYFYDFFCFTIDANAVKVNRQDNATVVKLIYISHKCMLFIGVTSRYRSLLSRYLPPADHESYDPALEMYRNAELLLPAFGDARNHLGMVYNDQNMKFFALYEFLRASLSRIPSSLGASNYQKILSSTNVVIDKLNKIRLEKATKKTQFERSSIYFFALFGYYSLPSSWKKTEGTLINGTKISALEKDLFDIFTDIANDGDSNFFFEKIFITLIGSIKLNNTSKSITPELNNLLKFTFKFITYLQAIFLELWYDNEVKSFKLLPLFRIIYSWIKVDKLALQYSFRSFEYLKLSALISNLIFAKYDDEIYVYRPERTQFFSEDVFVREFTPLDRLLYDFNDNQLFEGGDSPSKLIGQFQSHNFEEESKLRAIAIATIVKRLLEGNQVGIMFDEERQNFNLDNANAPIKKKKDVTKRIPLNKEVKKPEPKIQKVESSNSKQKRSKNKSNQVKKSNQDKKPKQLDISHETVYSKPENEQVYPKPEMSINSSSGESSIELSNIPTEKEIEKLTINDESPNIIKAQPIVNAEDLEAKLTGVSMVDSLVTNTYSTSNQNIWKSVQQPTTWGDENINPYPQYGQNIFNQPSVSNPPPSTGFQNIFSPAPQYQQYFSNTPSLQSQPTLENNQNMYLQYLNHYHTPQQHQTPQGYPYFGNNTNVQVPGTPINFQTNFEQNQNQHQNGNQYQHQHQHQFS